MWPSAARSFGYLLKAAIASEDILRGKTLHTLYIKSLVPTPTPTRIANYFIILYSRCRRLGAARSVFNRIKKPNVFSFNILLAAYVKESLIRAAHDLFDQIPRPDLVSYNTLISGYASSGSTSPAVILIKEMREMRIEMDEFTMSGAITACCRNAGLVRQFHCLVVFCGFDSHAAVHSSLITGYSRSELLCEAKRVFYGADEEGRNAVSWNSMIVAHVQHQEGAQALALFQEVLRRDIQLDMYTLASVLAAFTTVGALSGGCQFHAMLLKVGFHRSCHIGSGLIDLYAKCGGRMLECARVFDEIPSPDLVVWNTMICGFCQNEELLEEVLHCFRRMQAVGHQPDDCSFVGAISACSKLASPSLGKQIHALVVKSQVHANTITVNNALITMYSNCGSLGDSRRLFNSMIEHNTISLNSMITSYARHGEGKELLCLFKQMLEANMIPTSITFMSVLSACAHTGEVEVGREYFRRMMQGKFGVEPEKEHYSCMIDLLGRAGELEEAMRVIEAMPFSPGSAGWAALLRACNNGINTDLAERAADHLLQMEPQNAAHYVMLANVYSNAGRWYEMGRTRKLMRDRGVKKNPGCSWVELNMRTHVFLAEDDSHPMIKEIRGVVEEMWMIMKQPKAQTSLPVNLLCFCHR